MTDKLFSLVSRVFFAAAFGLLGLVLVEKAVNLAGFTILSSRYLNYSTGRLLEFASVLLLFVLALLLRQLREELKHGRS
ncbi:MAG TPA: hypothetical protein VJS92_08870 [Candidatus Polarisedimenticolaceae bacterium]|nr:hypothetical protein [Candidatus Polarisedimenticolaceae bacterium]